jgi:hypothetical protein
MGKSDSATKSTGCATGAPSTTAGGLPKKKAGPSRSLREGTTSTKLL